MSFTHPRFVASRLRALTFSSPASIAAVLLAACTAGGEGDSTAATMPTADTVTLSARAVELANFGYDSVATTAFRDGVSLPARLILDPQRVERIGSITEGRVKQVNARVGDRVSAGQVLVLIHSHEIMDARSGLARADAQVIAADNERRLAIAGKERAQRLLEAKAMSRAEAERLDAAANTAAAMYQQAIAERERAAALVEHLTGNGSVPRNADPHDVLIRTPISGVLVSRDVQPGQVVLPGTPMLAVGDPSRLLLQIRAPERVAIAVREGQDVVFRMDGVDAEHHAVVQRVAPTIDTLTRTVEILARPTSSRALLAEAFARAEVTTGDGRLVTMVPWSAIQDIEGDTVVITAEQRGEATFLRAVPVRVGQRNSRFAELVDGPPAGTRVLARGAAIAKAELLKRRGVGGEE